MLGFRVSQATVSRYMPGRSRRTGQSWQTFLRNQAMAFVRSENFEESSRRDASPDIGFDSDQLKQSEAVQILPSGAVLTRSSGRSQLALNNRSIRLRSAKCDRAVWHRAALSVRPTRRAVHNSSGVALPIRSPPCNLGLPCESFALRRADEILRSQAKARNEVVSSTPHGAA